MGEAAECPPHPGPPGPQGLCSSELRNTFPTAPQGEGSGLQVHPLPRGEARDRGGGRRGPGGGRSHGWALSSAVAFGPSVFPLWGAASRRGSWGCGRAAAPHLGHSPRGERLLPKDKHPTVATNRRSPERCPVRGGDGQWSVPGARSLPQLRARKRPQGWLRGRSTEGECNRESQAGSVQRARDSRSQSHSSSPTSGTEMT